MLALGLAGVAVLAGCRTSPNVAAYVGDAEVSVAELQTAVDERLADPDIAAFAAGDEIGYVRQVLTLEVTEELYAAAARRFDVTVSDQDVEARIVTLLGGGDRAATFQQLAQQQGLSESDVEENVRQQIFRVELASAEGRADLSEAGLQQRYQQSLATLGQVQLGVITVADQVTADAVRAQLTADPAAYPALAAQYPGPNTLPAVRPFASGDVPDVLTDPVAATPPGQTFIQAIPEVGIVVGLVAGVTTPTFEEARPQLAQQAGTEADQAGAALLQEFRDDLDVTVNPRYGVLEEGQIVAGDGGVVQLLDEAGGDAAAAPAGGGGG